jgi:hypothetical protein
MAFTYSKLAETTLSSSAATVTLNNIPQNYTDLKVVLSARNSADSVLSFVQFNGSSTNLSFRNVYGAPTATGSANGTSNVSIYGGTNASSYTSNTFSNVEIHIPNYTGSTNKSFSVDAVSETNATENYLSLTAGLWSNTAAITSVTLIPGLSGNFAQYSTFSLYGIRVEL